MNEHRGMRIAYVALCAIALLPVWSVHYLPTSDGPSHLYNAWIIRQLVTGSANHAVASAFRVDWRPHPNWIGHAAMAVLLFVFPPLVVEKIFFSAIVVTFLAGAWALCRAVDERCAAFAFIAFPFAYHALLHDGFYNFAMSASLFLIVIAFWWRHRDDPSPRTIAIVALLLVLCYFSHAMGVALAVGAIGVLWLGTLRGRNAGTHSRHLAAFVPALALMGWFASVRGTAHAPNAKPARELVTFLIRGDVLFSFDRHQLTYGRLIVAALALLAIATAVRHRFPLRWREADAFFVVFCCFLTLYFLAPGGAAGGELITERLALFVSIALLPWFSPDLPKPVRIAVAVAFGALALVNTAYLIRHYRWLDRLRGDFLAASAAIPPGSVVLPLIRDHNVVTNHAIDYVAIDRQLVDVDNYEAGLDYFPVAWNNDARPPAAPIEASPEEVDVALFARVADAVFASNMPVPVLARIRRIYRTTAARSDAIVFTRPALLDTTTILLPLAGTEGELATANGARWRIDQSIRNASGEPADVAMNGRVVVIDAGESLPVATDQQPPYMLLRVAKTIAPQLEVSTVLRRVDAHFVANVPAIREADLLTSPIVIRGVPPRTRVTVRLWLFGAAPRSHCTVVCGTASREVTTGPDGFSIVQLDDVRGDVVITARDRNAKLWAFASTSDPPTLSFPR